MHLVPSISVSEAFTVLATLSLVVEIHQASCGKIQPTALLIWTAHTGLSPTADALWCNCYPGAGHCAFLSRCIPTFLHCPPGKSQNRQTLQHQIIFKVMLGTLAQWKYKFPKSYKAGFTCSSKTVLCPITFLFCKAHFYHLVVSSVRMCHEYWKAYHLKHENQPAPTHM